MTIRARLTIWYATILLLSLVLKWGASLPVRKRRDGATVYAAGLEVVWAA